MARRDDAAPASSKPVAYLVASGRSITTRRGIMDAGSVVSGRDFADGEDGDACIRELVEGGHLVIVEG